MIEKFNVNYDIETTKGYVEKLLKSMYGKPKSEKIDKDIVHYPAFNYFNSEICYRDTTVSIRKVNNSKTVVILKLESILDTNDFRYKYMKSNFYDKLKEYLPIALYLNK